GRPGPLEGLGPGRGDPVARAGPGRVRRPRRARPPGRGHADPRRLPAAVPGQPLRVRPAARTDPDHHQQARRALGHLPAAARPPRLLRLPRCCPRPDHGRVWGLALRQIGGVPRSPRPGRVPTVDPRMLEDAMTLKILPHGRLQEWVAEEQGYFAAEGLEYAFLPEGDYGVPAGQVSTGAFETFGAGRGGARISCAVHWGHDT